ncbi:hypothetical protein BV378_14265 [Nostoc sp. RF31YmG]|jgi:fucose 4-O-acetylase-like acetyltransferase|nr:hypothetical protein BV378_14265 [Nostoc sp. RF31YmG]
MRNLRIDAAKAVLIVLVVFGHFIEWAPIGQDQILYRFIYLFHMPAFVFLSGLVCADIIDGKGARRILGMILLPYLAHQAVSNGMVALLKHEPFALSVGQPYWALWYLLSLCCWRLLMPLLLATGWPLTVAIAVSLLSGFGPEFDHAWSAGRTATFLPFFVLGHQYAKRHGIDLPVLSVRRGLLALGVVAAVAFATRAEPFEWLWGHTPYAEFAATQWRGFVLRLLQLCAGAVGTLGLLRLVGGIPLLATIGQRSLAIFIAHIYVLKALRVAGLFERIESADWPLKLVAALVATLVITAACWMAGRLVPWAFDFTWLLDRVDRLRQRLVSGRMASKPA